MTADDVKRARSIIAAATPGPWTPYLHEIKSLSDFLQGCTDAFMRGDIGKCYFVSAKTYEQGPPHLFTSIVGNGPKSANNTEFIAAARTGWPEALDEVERLQQELSVSNQAIWVWEQENRKLRAVANAAEKFEKASHDYPEQTNFFVSDQNAFITSQRDLGEAIKAWRDK